MPRFAGRATMMRLPFIEDLQGLDAAFVGIPLDIGTSQRSGTRYGPRYIRAESVMIRPYNMATGAAPFDSLSVADIGDVPINTYSLLKSVQIIEDYYTGLNSYPLIPLTLGGDHTITLPILRALTKKHGPVGLIHVDAHTDTNDEMFGEKIAHGTTFRRAVEEGLLDLKRVVQIGQRAQGYAAGDFQWGVDRGLSPGAGGAVLAYLAGAADGRKSASRWATGRCISALISIASIPSGLQEPGRRKLAV